MENVDINVTISGLDEMQRLTDELQQSVEKTRALAVALVKACDKLDIKVNKEPQP